MLIDLFIKASHYFIPGGSVSFWHTPFAPVFYDFSSLSNYYIDFSTKTKYAGPFDPCGVPLLNYRGRIGLQYNPCAVAQYALGWYSRCCKGNSIAKYKFIKFAKWLADNLHRDTKGHGYWYYQFDLPSYGVKAPWISALAQGQGISALLRAYRITKNAYYLDSAVYACNTLISKVEDGGTLRIYDGRYFLEEVVTNKLTAILDGMIFAIFGLQDFCFVKSTIESNYILKKCYDTLIDILPLYDLGFWSRADLHQDTPPMISSHFYHGLHIAQLRVLENLTGIRTFGIYAKCWQKHLNSRPKRIKAWILKAFFKLRYY